MEKQNIILNIIFEQLNKKNIITSIVYLSGVSMLFLILDALKSYNYLLFHSVAEMISVILSVVIFVIVLTVWRYLVDNNCLCFLGITFFFVGVIDGVHMLGYGGMGVFDEFDSDLGIQLWILARYIQAFSLLISALLLQRRKQINKYIIFGIYSIIVAFAFGMIFYWRVFPQCFSEDSGLTSFKIISEYIICILFMSSAIVILQYKKFFSKDSLWLLMLAIAFQILAELTFTTYMNLYSFSNFLGHYLKIIAIAIFCKVILVSAMKSPIQLLYTELERKKYQLEEAQRIGNMGSWELNLISNELIWSEEFAVMLGFDKNNSAFSYENFLGMIHPEDLKEREIAFQEAVQNKEIYISTHRLLLGSGQIKVVYERGELSYDERWSPVKINCVIKDITEETKSKDEIVKMNNNLGKMVVERTIQLEELNCDLEETNAMLEEEITERQKVETEMLRLNNSLEGMVMERTTRLEEINAMLEEEITERQKVELEIKELNSILDKSNTLLTSVLESSPEVIVFVLDTNYCYLNFNTRHKEVMLAIWGKEIKIGMNILEAIGDHEDSHKAEHNFKRVLAGESFTMVEEYGAEEYSRLTWQNYWSPIFSDDGKVIGITCFLMDITEVKKTEDALKKSEERFRIMFEQAPLGIALVDSLTGHIYHVNPRFAKIAGRTIKEITVMNWMSITHPDDLQEDLNNMDLLNAGKITDFRMNKRYIKPNNSIVWINMTIAPLRIVDGNNPCHLCMIEDITERKAIQERLERYQIIVEKANDIILFIDHEGNILEVNDAAVRMYGYTFEEFLSMTIFDLRRMEKAGYIMKQIEVAQKEGIIFETIHYRKDGSCFPAEVSSQGNKLGDKRVILSIVRDITERKKHEEILISTMKKAEEANAAKAQFLANMSHEIRTPMNGIIGMTDLALVAECEEEQKEYLRIVKSSTMSLLRVLNDILDYSKMEAGKIDLEEVPFNLLNTITEVIELFDVSAKQKGLTLSLYFDSQIPAILIGDSLRLRQVLSNLVGNGIKFTSHGEVTIRVTMEEGHENKVKIRFLVTDTGIGISKDKLDKLFKRFSQVDESNTRQFGGTGLGLAISQKLVEIMGGKISVESQDGIGSQFFFTASFKVQEEEQCLVADASNPKEFNSLEKLQTQSILLVEDDIVSRKIVTHFLMKHGFKVIAVENGKEAVTILQKENFDLILMDINMPYLDGYSVTAILRSNQENMNYSTPIIAMTAYALKGDREKCLEAGIDDYLSKPINLNEFLEMVQRYVGVVGSNDNSN